MKRTLMLIIIALLIALFGYMLYQNFTVAGVTLYGIRGLSEENDKLDEKIGTASQLSSVDYPTAITNLKSSAKDFQTTKESYDELVTMSTTDDITSASQLEKYEIEYLWAQIGSHATKEDVVLKLEISANSTSEATGYYDLNFTASGDYVGITDFIYDIENDSSLGFKIENFKMTSAITDGSSLEATFTCKDISINIDASNLSSQNEESEESEETDDEDDTNTTNTSSSNTTTNES